METGSRAEDVENAILYTFYINILDFSNSGWHEVCYSEWNVS
jgi:hypothetical protein